MDDRTRELELIASALSLAERAGLASAAAESPDARARVEAWERRVISGAEPSRFDTRLAWLGLDRKGALRAASTPRLPASFARPRWIEVLEQVEDVLAREPEPPSVDLAFGEYWQGWRTVSRQRLGARLAELDLELPAPIVDALERGLGYELSALGASSLMSAFDDHRLPWQLGPGYTIARLSPTPPNVLYKSFVKELRSTPLLRSSFPALLRLCATRLSSWVDAVVEFAQRLEADRVALGAVVGRELGPICSLEDRISDSHAGARRVFIATFSDGLRVVYKPRGVRSELAFARILEWTNERLADGPVLDTHWVLDRDQYGWSEWVAPLPCPESDAHHYYERAGMLLALAHVLVGSDCHEENVIAHGASPVLVDVETFAGPRLFPPDEDVPEYADAVESIETSSVLSIGMLPGWTWSRFGAADVSGFGGEGKGRYLKFEKLNTDLMRLVRSAEQTSRLSANQPRLASGEAIDADRHVDAILKGFERVYELVRGRVDEFVRSDGPLALLRAAPARVVFRDTQQYSQVLGASLKAAAMQDGLTRSLSLEDLASEAVALTPLPEWAPALLSDELESLFQGDIPLFLAGRETGELVGADGSRLGTMHAESTGMRRVEARLKRLGPADLTLQKRCIESAFISRAIRVAAVHSTRDDQGAGTDEPRLEEIGLGMARAVRECSIQGPRGGRFWLGLESETSDRVTSRVGVIGPWLYSGHAGIALALATAYSRSGDTAFAGAARAALRPVRELLTGSLAPSAIGAFEGISGVVYSLWHSARLLDEPSLVDDARELLRRIDRKSIEGDQIFDVTSGTAGLILALRSVVPVEGELVREIVGHAARHLVHHARAVEGGVGWPNWLEPRPLCGMAHGNSGIAWALMEAFRLTGDETFREVARAATDYERARRLESSDGAWPDLRKQPKHVAGWCHGPPGIALARLGMLQVEDRAELRADLELARELMLEHAEGEPRAHLCCGQTGIDDVLLELGVHFGDAATIALARSRASARIRSLGENPDSWMHPGRGRVGVATIPGLMKGWSGIVSTLLRLSDPGGGAPCVLGLEP